MELSPNIQQRIQILPDAVKRKIAAGEVIDGPYSVIKELVENALDAQATDIDIEIEESGLKRIVVRDNGIGIYRDDLPLAVEEHATSKIKSIDDIFSIITMGFRGEALSSIAEVSHCTILSRTAEEEIGGKLVIDEGKKELFDWAGPTGTTIIVENLFFNTPARKKFIKGLKSELNRIKDTIFALAIANSRIQFKVKIDNKIAFVFEPADTLQRIAQIYGNEMADNLLYGSLSDLHCTIEGYCTKPNYYRSNRSLQFLYVNHRPVQFPYFNFILQQVYQTILQKGQYPAAFIFCNIKPDLIDVNVHPAKKEIRFFDNNYIHSMIYNFANKLISGTIHAFPIKHNDTQLQNNNITTASNANNYTDNNTPPLLYTQPNVNPQTLIHEVQHLYTQLHNKDYSVIGTIFGSYVLIQKENNLYIIDFHAAHEKKLFDYLMSIDSVSAVQQLIMPVVMELSPDLLIHIHSYKDILTNYGIIIDQFDEHSIVINAIPDFCNTNDIEGLMRDIVDSLHENKYSLNNIKIKIIEKIACHSAKRANDIITQDDIIAIADYVLSTNDYRCPHGRPFVYIVSKSELERFFKRS
ncbi:MAG TPA: DNA mismatch repair endonuclease MutL [Spirochaetota bacterium]|nr:DNA mismatch repair endonuclease MutL [Spirochaetota bacterium]HOM08871.1 DNA mismatch repair endonuclease MutL [Spirochaetota bacterium]HPP48666.1 DNA mismatch repair endonuclease MutL [Spirochaetota bacterium]